MDPQPGSHACCGGSEADAPTVFACPACGQPGRPVPVGTLRALLNLRRDERIPEDPWRFGDGPTCGVVYFGVEAAQAIRGAS